MESDVSFEAAKNAVRQWVAEVEQTCRTQLRVEPIRDDPDFYWVLFHFQNSMVQVIVSDPDWAPFRYVLFEVISAVNQDIQPVFTWLDGDGDNLESITQNLWRGLEFALNYNDKLDRCE